MQVLSVAMIATCLSASLTAAANWQIDFYNTQDCSGDAKSSEGDDPACLAAAGNFAILVAGEAHVATDDQCMTVTGNAFPQGTCVYLATSYVYIEEEL